MDLTACYCPTRRNLEERGWILVSHLSRVSAGLLRYAGVDPKAFNVTSTECSCIRNELAATHRLLSKHREQHGC